MKLSQFIVHMKLARSKSEAKHLIKQGAISLIRDGVTFILKADMPVIW